eukprot:10465259-Prorocentrum_lima.AAC.1
MSSLSGSKTPPDSLRDVEQLPKNATSTWYLPWNREAFGTSTTSAYRPASKGLLREVEPTCRMLPSIT